MIHQLSLAMGKVLNWFSQLEMFGKFMVLLPLIAILAWIIHRIKRFKTYSNNN